MELYLFIAAMIAAASTFNILFKKYDPVENFFYFCFGVVFLTMILFPAAMSTIAIVQSFVLATFITYKASVII